ncbi:MAG: hypothetical protein ACRCY8_18290 [Dermatophilaceae bacterium]
MRGVGPGTVLGGRYTVRRRLEQRSGTERWDADDTTLGRRVSILAIPADDPRTGDLLDAARRAASVTHPVFIRVLDVGADPDLAYVVEEDLDGAHSLTELVVGGGVPGDEVRRISGEVAAALEAARQRGLHHLDLTPDDVLRTAEGDVRLRGLEIAAVRADEEGVDAGEAGRRDAVGVVALAYAGLTGLWPLGSGGSGLGPAPRVSGGVAAPSEIAAGVPRDLDALCRLTLNDDHGPTSPGDYARQVAPWPTRQVVGRPATPQADADDARTATPPAWGGHADTDPGDGAAERADDEPAPGADAGVPRAMAVDDAEPAAGDTEPSTVDEPGWDIAGTGTEHTQVLVRSTPSFDGAPTTETPGPPTQQDHMVGPSAGTTAAAAGTGAAAGSAGAAVGAAAAAVAGAFSSLGERAGGLTRRAADRVSDLRAAPSPDRSAGHLAGSVGEPRWEEPADPQWSEQPSGSPWDAHDGAVAVTAPQSRVDDPLDPPAPLVPGRPLTRDESRLALRIVAGFVILALAIAVWGVTRIGSNTADFGLGGSDTPVPAAPSTPSAPAPSPTTTSSPGAPPPAEPLAVLGVRSYDPEGDGEENDNLTPKAYDGDPNSGWYSENYRNDEFGGLKKGLGLIVDLGPNKKPQQVRLDLPVASDIQVFLGPDARLDGATKVGERAAAQGQVSFDVPANLTGQYVIVWYTKVSVDDRGKRRAWLDEVVVAG